MADYLVTGQRGAGKGIVMVSRMRDSLLRGKPIATNMDLRLDKMLPLTNRTARVIRVPDFPSGEDLHALGRGGSSRNEKDFGELVLDELAVWLNARGWADKTRQSFLEWLPLSRKFRWNTYFTTQLLNSLDKQVRDLLEHRVHVIRLDRMRIPFIGWFLALLGGGAIVNRLPRVHLGVVTYGSGPNSMLVERWTYRGSNIREAYNTEQIYSKDYPYGTYCYLPPWYFVDRSNVFICGKRVGGFQLYRHPETGELYGWPGRPESWGDDPPYLPVDKRQSSLVYILASLFGLRTSGQYP